jgi:hypothetical protein
MIVSVCFHYLNISPASINDKKGMITKEKDYHNLPKISQRRLVKFVAWVKAEVFKTSI